MLPNYGHSKWRTWFDQPLGSNQFPLKMVNKGHSPITWFTPLTPLLSKSLIGLGTRWAGFRAYTLRFFQLQRQRFSGILPPQTHVTIEEYWRWFKILGGTSRSSKKFRPWIIFSSMTWNIFSGFPPAQLHGSLLQVTNRGLSRSQRPATDFLHRWLSPALSCKPGKCCRIGFS